MAGRLKVSEWNKIIAELEADPNSYGMPEGGREESLVLASFNIRKLSKSKDRERELDFLSRFCARCDLIAIQEVLDDLDGLLSLKERMEKRIAGDNEFGVVVSDITGEVPGEKAMPERLAFIYRRRRIRRLDMASDLNIDRTAVMKNFFANHEEIVEAHKKWEEKMKEFKAGKRRKPAYTVPTFVTFIRSPHVVAFEIPAANGAKPITFAAVNAHLIYGQQRERDAEFVALMDWLTWRLKDQKRMTVDNLLLMGDLNLNFDKPRTDRNRIEKKIRSLNKEVFGNAEKRRIYFPFIDPDPHSGVQLRTNARQNQTFDQIGFFLGSREKQLPNDTWREGIDRQDPDGFDYGVFNFADLFARTLKNKPYSRLTTAEKQSLGKSFEHSVSDHMPIWVRIPRPGF